MRGISAKFLTDDVGVQTEFSYDVVLIESQYFRSVMKELFKLGVDSNH